MRHKGGKRKFAGRNMHIEFHNVNPKKSKAADCIYLTENRECQNKKSPHYLSKCFAASYCTFKVKENAELSGKYTRLSTEKYGGMLMGTWLDRPLSVAGRVMVETEKGVESKLVDIDRDLLMIPNVAIHMNRQANDGYKWNPAVDTLPLIGGGKDAGKFWELLEQAAGGKVLGHDLYLYIRQ